MSPDEAGGVNGAHAWAIGAACAAYLVLLLVSPVDYSPKFAALPVFVTAYYLGFRWGTAMAGLSIAVHLIFVWVSHSSAALAGTHILARYAIGTTVMLVIAAMTAYVTGLTRRLKREVSRRKEAEEKYWALSRTDELTRLGNRRCALDDLQTIAQRLLPETKPLSVVFIDLDNLKQVNDRLGHVKGDELILTTANLVNAHLGERATLYRLSGDEFLIILDGVDLNEAQQLMREVEVEVARYNEAGALSQKVEFSYGVAEYDKVVDGSVTHVVERADDLMYRNKIAKKRAAHHGGGNVLALRECLK